MFGVWEMKNITKAAFQIYLLIMWFYAIFQDAEADKIAYVVVDILLPPIGVIRGIIIYFF